MIVLSARQAEEANRDLAKIARMGNSGLMLVPVEARGTVSASKTPRIHLSKTGEFLAPNPASMPGAGPWSGAPRQRVNPAAAGQRRPWDDMATSRPAPAPQGPQNSVTTQRSKRPKTSMSVSHRQSLGGDASDKHKWAVPAKRVLNDLMRHHHAWPFAKPVDPLQVPGYYDVIKDAIDLGTIKTRLERGMYEDVEEFESEVKRVWANCYKFNQDPNHDIVKMAKTLEGLFDEKMEAVPRGGDAEGSEEMKKMRREMMRMQKAMAEQQKLMRQQNELTAQSMQLAQHAHAVAPQGPRRQSTGGGRRNSSAGATVQQQALAVLQNAVQQDETAEMTFEQKASLGGGINRLSSNNLAEVVKLIRENMPTLGAGQEEIEIDINALDNRTLWKLWNFVETCKAVKKRPPKRAAETADSRARAITQAQGNIAQQLTQTEAGLRAYEQPSGPQGIALQQQDDNDSPADSESDSDDDGPSLPTPANANGGGSSNWQDFQNARKQREQEQQERNAQAARANERAQYRAPPPAAAAAVAPAPDPAAAAVPPAAAAAPLPTEAGTAGCKAEVRGLALT